VRAGDVKCIGPHSAFKLAITLEEANMLGTTEPGEENHILAVSESSFSWAHGGDSPIPIYRAILDVDPTHFASFLNLASWLHWTKHDKAEAEELYLKALKLKPEHLLTRLSLVELYAQGDKQTQAYEMLDSLPASYDDSVGGKFTAHDPQETLLAQQSLDLRLQIIAAIMLHMRGTFDKAALEYKRSIELLKQEELQSSSDDAFLRPAIAILHFNWAIICDRLGDSKTAKQHWEESLDLMPDVSEFLPHTFFADPEGYKLTDTPSFQALDALPDPLFPLWEDTVVDARGRVLAHGPYFSICEYQGLDELTDAESENLPAIGHAEFKSDRFFH